MNNVSLKLRNSTVTGLTNGECLQLKILGSACALLFVASLIFNTLLLVSFVKNKKLLSTVNVFILCLTVFNLTGTLFQLPVFVLNQFHCRWIFDFSFCIVEGFLMYFIGCTTIYLFCAISIERLYTLYNPDVLKRLNKRFYLPVMSICICLGLIWPMAPLFGWSYYNLEGAGTTCSVEWNTRSPSVTSYNVTIFLFVFLLPFSFILASNLKLVCLIRQTFKAHSHLYHRQAVRSRLLAEKRITVSLLISTTLFGLSWLPYALTSMYTAFIDERGVDKMMSTLPSVISKTSMLWTPVTFILTDQNIKRDVGLRLKYTASLFSSYNETIRERQSNKHRIPSFRRKRRQ